jgi:hypothetical protein
MSLVNEIREHAHAHYSEGWDEVIECWTDGDIAEAIGRARTFQGALKKVWKIVKLRNGHRREIEATAFGFEDRDDLESYGYGS